MDERLRFVARILEGEAVTDVCREFGIISRKTGYKILARYKDAFMHYDLGYIDLEQKTLQPIDNPFSTRVSPMS